MPKHTNVIDVKDIVEWNEELINGLLQLERDELVVVLAHVANEALISTSLLETARIDLPSFSATKWSDLAPQFGLPQMVPQMPPHFYLCTFQTPRYRLPLSLHKTMFENAWLWRDICQEKVDQTNVEATVRILDLYIIPILALFQGRVIDIPEEALTKLKYLTGGKIEHQIFMLGGILLVIKVGKPTTNSLAHLFLEFLSAAESNKANYFAGLRIYGILTDLVSFQFYSYDPTANKFSFDETIIINTRRLGESSDMMDVSNKIFGIILSAYTDGLQARYNKSIDMARCSIGNAPPEPFDEEEDSRATALMLAMSCRAKLEERVASLLDIEEKALEALALLARSAGSILRASSFTGGDDNPSNLAELKLLATRVTNETHERYLSKLTQCL